ncbi:MAG: hypothetical protein ACTSO7_08090 [Candidatus Heimdallarchaeota archaeon]
MSEDPDYFNKYMQTALGTPEPIIKGVLLFFQSRFTAAKMDELMSEISQQEKYTLDNTVTILHSYGVDDEIQRQIIALMNKKFKEAIEKKELTAKKLDFIRSVKKKH